MIYNHYKKAKKKVRAIIAFLPIVLLSFITACVQHEDHYIEEETFPLTFYLQTAGSQHTRAYIGDVAAKQNEQAIHTIKVWLFDINTNTCISYSNSIDDNKVTMSIPKGYVGQSVNVYIIANAESVGLNGLDGGTILSDLQAAILGSKDATTTYFTPANPTIAVPTEGLPMSRIVKNCPITLSEDGIKAKLPEIKITRAVSKIRFAFARMKDNPGQVVGITLHANQIASQESIFPVEPSESNAADYTSPYLGDLRANIVSGSYMNNVMTLGSTDGQTVLAPSSNIQEVYDLNDATVDPTIYTWTNWSGAHSSLTSQQKAEQYNTLMDTYVTNEVYLRESDKQLTGTIYYRFSNTEEVKSVDFSMSQTSDIQDFARNHEWIVYGYFMNGEIILTVTVMPWELKESTIVYSQTPMYNGTATWKANTYDETMSYPSVAEEEGGIRTIALRTATVAEYSFEITSPQGFSWIATFTSLEGNPRAFKFVHADNSLSDTFTGTIGTGPTTLRIKAATDTPSESSAALLTLTVRQGEGKNIPLQELSIYKIVQIAN